MRGGRGVGVVDGDRVQLLSLGAAAAGVRGAGNGGVGRIPLMRGTCAVGAWWGAGAFVAERRAWWWVGTLV